MRCKPNTLAVFTNPPPALADLAGVIVTTVRPVTYGCRACWVLDRMLRVVLRNDAVTGSGLHFVAGEVGWLDTACDDWLRPIDAGPEPESIDVPAETYAFG
jgi:hypothetical protein